MRLHDHLKLHTLKFLARPTCTLDLVLIVRFWLKFVAAGDAATSSATLPPSGQSSTGGPVPATTASGQSGSQGNLYADLN